MKITKDVLELWVIVDVISRAIEDVDRTVQPGTEEAVRNLSKAITFLCSLFTDTLPTFLESGDSLEVWKTLTQVLSKSQMIRCHPPAREECNTT